MQYVTVPVVEQIALLPEINMAQRCSDMCCNVLHNDMTVQYTIQWTMPMDKHYFSAIDANQKQDSSPVISDTNDRTSDAMDCNETKQYICNIRPVR